MNFTLYNKIVPQLDEIITLLNKSIDLKRMVTLKEEIKKDLVLKEELKQLKENFTDPYSKEYQELRKKLFADEKIHEYIFLENDLTYFVMELNQLLKELTTERKDCQ